MAESSDNPCSICSQLANQAFASQKFGWDEYNTYLPDAAKLLILVKDFKPFDSRKLQLHQCPECKKYYLYRTDYEYLVNGSEDEESLTRLTEEEAEEYKQRPAPG